MPKIEKKETIFRDKEGKPKIANLLILGTAIALVILVPLSTMLVTVGAGEVGVIFDPLAGGIIDMEIPEGLHFKTPWQTVDRFNIKLQTLDLNTTADEVQCITNEGLYVDLDVTIWFRIQPANASVIRQTISTEGTYQTTIVAPAVRSALREVIARYEAADIYGDARAMIAVEVMAAVNAELTGKCIDVEDVLLRDVALPQQLTESIEQKKQAEQQAQRMVYIIEAENLERHRKIIEAEGISSANDIIAGSLTNEYLTWYWISNLDSHNSVLYVPVGESGIPLFREVTEPTGD